jgi:tRNA threonylcarbamoyl adenosine modification protein YeaZ
MSVAPKDLLVNTKNSINIDIMNFLSIDCSTDISSLFVKIKNKTFIKILQSDKLNNDVLMKKILDFFAENNLNINDINEVFVNQGPGNFSSLRGSLAVAKGICLSKNIRLFGYNTFTWICSSYFGKQDFIYALFKFKEKYYVQKFSKTLRSISKIKLITIDDILQKYKDKFLVFPNSIKKDCDKKILQLNNINIVDLNHNELEFLKLKGLLDKDLIKPLYLS